MAARQARLLRQQGEMLREEFQAVLGPIEAAALREAALPLQGLTLEALVSRTELLLHGIGERVADWSARGGLLAQAHARLAPVLSSAPLLEQVRNLAALKDTLR